MNRIVNGLFVLFFLPLQMAFAAQSFEHTKVEVILPESRILQGATTDLLIRFTPEPGWHIYWKNPGDSGLPPKAEWTMPEGVRAGEMLFPAPELIRFHTQINYGYNDPTDFIVPIETDSDIATNQPLMLKLQLKWLICKEECLPGKANFTIDVSVRPQTEAGVSAEVQRARAKLPRVLAQSDFEIRHLKSGAYQIRVHEPKSSVVRARFFQDSDAPVSAGDVQKFKKNKEGFELSIFPKDLNPKNSMLSGVLVVGLKNGSRQAFEIPNTGSIMVEQTGSRDLGEGDESPLYVMLFFAFVGGLILNLMPCILPVLSIKVLEFVSSTQVSRKKIITKGLGFTAGVLASFWSLMLVLFALKQSGHFLGWGFQLQSPVFVACLCVLFFLMALSLLGYFEVGDELMGFAGKLSKHKHAEHPLFEPFFSGVLTTVAATPCSAPFMGTALGFALSQSLAISLLVLTFLGLGLAFPYLLFSLIPSATRVLPKPGAWMLTFKQVLAFPLLATVVWLVWVMAGQVDAMGIAIVLCLLLGCSFLIWLSTLKTKNKHHPHTFFQYFISVVVLAMMLWSLVQLSAHARTKVVAAAMVEDSLWKPFSEQALQKQLSDGKSVFLDFTADWCVTCKVNEKLVLSSQKVIDEFEKKGVVLMRGDWTNNDPEIAAFLQKQGRNSVPVYLYYKNRRGRVEKTVLPQILSVEVLKKVL